jgi:tetratricopeptide (TPR) repeat protein
MKFTAKSTGGHSGRRCARSVLAIVTVGLVAGSLAMAQMKVKSRGEGTAVNAMLGATDPDARIKAAEDLLAKYADTSFKAYALYIEADAWQRKNDPTKAMFYAEESVNADPTRFDAALILTNLLSDQTRSTDLDKEDKFKRIQSYAEMALKGLETAQKPNPSLPDAQWAAYKNENKADATQALAHIEVLRGKFDEGAKGYNDALALNPDPLIMIRAGRAFLDMKKPEEAVAWFDKALASPKADETVKRIATADKARATQQLKK